MQLLSEYSYACPQFVLMYTVCPYQCYFLLFITTLLLQLDLNPVLMASFMGLLTAYAKLHITLSRLDERKAALGLYFAAAAAARRRPAPSWPALTALIAACDDPVKAVAAELAAPEYGPLHDTVAATLCELSESVRLALDCDALRAAGALNVLAGGEGTIFEKNWLACI